MAPQLIAGNINNLDPDEFRTALKEAGIKRLDTAARYMNGESEKVLGRNRFPKDFDVDTKILIGLPADGHLSAEKIHESFTHSLEVLHTDKVNVLYCHGPDYQTPIAEQARAFDEHFKKAQFTHVCL